MGQGPSGSLLVQRGRLGLLSDALPLPAAHPTPRLRGPAGLGPGTRGTGMVSTVGEMQGCDFSEGGRLEPRRPEGLVGEAAPGKGAGVSEVGGGADLRAGPSRVLGPPSPPPPPAKHRTDPVTSVLGLSGPVAPQKERGLWAPRHQPCPASPGSGSPGLREQAREGLVVAPAALFSVHSPGGPVRARGSAMGAAEGARERAWVCTLSSSRPARQEVSPHPQPGPWRGPTSWKAVRHLSRPRKPG